MFARKALASFLSFVLALSMVPVAALAEVQTDAASEGQAEHQVATPLAEFRVNAPDDAGEDEAWVWFESKEKAEEAASKEQSQEGNGQAGPTEESAEGAAEEEPAQEDEGPQGAVPVTRLELRLKGSQEGDTIELATRASDDAWPEEWAPRGKDQRTTFVDLKVRLSAELAKTYDVWYRVHVNGSWLDWQRNGDAAAQSNEHPVDDVQVVLMARDDDQADNTSGQEEAPSEVTDAPSANEGDDAAKESVSAPEQETATPVAAEAVAPAPTVTYKVHVQSRGWMGAVTNGAVAGTTGESKRLEAITISLPKDADGGISYKVHAQSHGWMNTVSNGTEAGTTGESKRLEAIQIWLTGNLTKDYDVWYRVHAQSYGWMSWVKNGKTAGTTGKSKRLEAIQIVVVPKGAQAPTANADVTGKAGATGSISYRSYTAGFGWQGWMHDGQTSGTTGLQGRVEGFSASLASVSNSELRYAAYMQSSGWQKEVAGGQVIGQPGKGKRLEAIRMSLSGTAAANFDIYYRCHIQSYGWLNWAKNGANAGSVGLDSRLEAIQVVLVPKGGAAPKNDSKQTKAFMSMPVVRYKAHVQSIGWQGWTYGGDTAGTIGQSKRMEALTAEVVDAGMSGEIQINAHVQNYGWRGYVGQGKTAGTTGQSKRVEAIRVRLTGNLQKSYDVWYRVHAQSYGWMGWAKNGASAGTEGMSKRLEALQIKLVRKGGAAPGSTNRPFVKELPSKTGYQNPAGYYQVSRRNVPVPAGATWPFNYITPSRIAVDASRQDCVNAFVQRAREYLGTPYMWDYACAPGVGVDCIGLVMQCAYATGMNMGTGTGTNDFNPWAHWVTGASGWHSHDANNFWNYGKALHVPLSSRRVGDCISYPGHIAIYVGNNTVIEAYTGIGVVQRNMYASGTPRGCIRLFQ